MYIRYSESTYRLTHDVEAAFLQASQRHDVTGGWVVGSTDVVGRRHRPDLLDVVGGEPVLSLTAEIAPPPVLRLLGETEKYCTVL